MNWCQNRKRNTKRTNWWKDRAKHSFRAAPTVSSRQLQGAVPWSFRWGCATAMFRSIFSPVGPFCVPFSVLTSVHRALHLCNWDHIAICVRFGVSFRWPWRAWSRTCLVSHYGRSRCSYYVLWIWLTQLQYMKRHLPGTVKMKHPVFANYIEWTSQTLFNSLMIFLISIDFTYGNMINKIQSDFEKIQLWCGKT